MLKSPNLDYIKQLSGGDKDFERKIITIIKKELPVEIQSYKKNISAREFEKAAENIHKIKHKIGIFQMEEAYKLAIDYEEALREKEDRYKEKFEIYLGQLKSFVESCEI
ncbi:hypothetical protein [Gramella sp. MAR_2010_147]|uniref:hypothetical protein n=1 Tax=Gramella sp. MAR_2010_147 TaxID=1250205 RepID=UPI00087B920C|nr:hypothetical protein [Gramella sp. MAR_2010_147]SDS21812.1 hypothetical protein SAMN04488553_1750 [Gramella sp. MAR_2010_147]